MDRPMQPRIEPRFGADVQPGIPTLTRQAPPRRPAPATTTAARPIERMQQPVESRRVSAGRLLVLLFSFAVIGAAGYGMNLAIQKVNSRKIGMVHIEGALTFVTEEQIKQTVGADVTTSLIAVDLVTIKQKLEALPWIREAEIRRQWPDAINIYVEEEIAIARWGAKQLLNQQGHVFEPESIEEQLLLPLLAGPENSEQKVMRQYQEFNQLLYPLGVRIRDLTLNDSGSYELTLINGVRVKLGREDVLERLRRLVVFLESDHGRDLQDVEAIDLRYRNGLAIARQQSVSSKVQQGNKVDGLVAL
ncbi:MAG: cell division protein FtsQ/DivIB [Pseudomonadota bacterium]